MFVFTSICPYYYILTYLFCVTVIHLLCYFMLCAFVRYSIKLLLLLLSVVRTPFHRSSLVLRSFKSLSNQPLALTSHLPPAHPPVDPLVSRLTSIIHRIIKFVFKVCTIHCEHCFTTAVWPPVRVIV